MKALMILTCVLGIASSATSAELSRGVHDVAIIQNEAGEGRFLFRAEVAADLGPVAVRRATLTVPIAGEESRGGGRPNVQDLRVYPVTRSWSAGSVDWNTGWSRGGGDYEDGLYGHADVDLSTPGLARFDVTVVVKEILERGMETHGFLLTVSPERGEGIDSRGRSAIPELSGAILEVEYRATPRPPTRMRG